MHLRYCVRRTCRNSNKLRNRKYPKIMTKNFQECLITWFLDNIINFPRFFKIYEIWFPGCLENASTGPTTLTWSPVTSTRPATRSKSSTRPFSAGNKNVMTCKILKVQVYLVIRGRLVLSFWTTNHEFTDKKFILEWKIVI